MSRRSNRVEIILLLLLASIPWPNPSNPGHNCPFEMSDVVRKIIQKKFIPILERYKATLPLDCPFHASRDLYGRRREGPELEGEPPGLVCWICGLASKTAKNLHQHYLTEHAGSLAPHDGAICLADYCTIMRCNVLMANEWLASLNVTKSIKASVSSSSSSKRQQQQQPQRWDITEWNNIDDASPGKTAAIETLKAREEARRGACNATQLRELQTKCEVIVRNCISGLLLSVSPKDFQEIEEDMNRAVCSFLTCEKFWEDSLVEEPRYPLGFFLAVLTMMGIGMIICYYIVWVVFDSGEVCSHEEYYKVYVLYSEHLMETKTPQKSCDVHRRRMAQQSWKDCESGSTGHDAVATRYSSSKKSKPEQHHQPKHWSTL